MHIHQVRPYEQWPSGDSRPIVMLRADPVALHERYGIEFEHDMDDFAEYDLAAIELPDRTENFGAAVAATGASPWNWTPRARFPPKFVLNRFSTVPPSITSW